MGNVFLISIALSLITILGDFFVKTGSMRGFTPGLKWVIPGAIIYALSAFGWFYVFSHKMKFSTAGVVYSVVVVTFHVLLSVFYFKEKIYPFEILGVVLAVLSLLILARYA